MPMRPTSRLAPALIAALTLLLLGDAASAQPAPEPLPPPRLGEPVGVGTPVTLAPADGFVDDAFALDATGARVAWIRANADATVAEVHVTEVTTGKDLAVFEVSKTIRRVARIAFVQDGKALLLVGTTGDYDKAKDVTAVFGVDGKLARKLDGAATLHVREGVEILAFVDRPVGGKLKLRLVRVADGKPAGKGGGTFKVDKGTIFTLGGAEVEELYWRHGYQELAGRKKGQYDKKTDERAPDTFAIYDFVAGKIVKDEPIADLAAFARLIALRARFANQDAIVAYNTEGDLELVNANDRRIVIKLAESVTHYLAASLVVGEGARAFTLTIDPVHADAVRAKKAAPLHLDLYVLDPATGAASRVARLPGGGDVRWQATGGVWAVLRKHKGFDRGGPALELYPITR